tara:strand:+ start:504 stop:671 length:168 start_codon:yes stop_codon:yes gene_type:complete
MINSPCNDVCVTDPENGLCVGCGRTSEEIVNWPSYTDKQKEIVLEVLKYRNNIDT